MKKKKTESDNLNLESNSLFSNEIIKDVDDSNKTDKSIKQAINSEKSISIEKDIKNDEEILNKNKAKKKRTKKDPNISILNKEEDSTSNIEKKEEEVKMPDEEEIKNKVENSVEKDKYLENSDGLKYVDVKNASNEYVETLIDIEEDVKNTSLEKPTTPILEFVRRDPDLKDGLTTDEVIIRNEKGLNNIVDVGSTKTIGRIIINNVCTFFNLIMFGLFIWILTIGSYQDMVFLVVVSLNIAIGIFQEIRAKKMVDKLSILSAPVADVIRDSTTIEVPIKELVIDDIILLEPGKQICADAIVRSGEIEVDESLLTGESDAILKKQGDTLLSGSYVISGNCKAQIFKVGKDSYIQKLTTQAKKYKRPKSDLMKSLKILITTIACFIVPMGVALFLIQYENSHNYEQSVLGTTGALIGMIPSGLYLLTSVSLFVGVIRLGKSNTLVQELYCIESLARVNMLCLDKTGTITDGTMTVTGVSEYDNNYGINCKTVIASMIAILNDKNQTATALEQKFGVGKKCDTVWHYLLLVQENIVQLNSINMEHLF